MQKAKKVIFCDFDGTIIEQDIGRIMVPQLAPEWWSRVEEIYPLVLSEKMGSHSWYYWKFLHAQINENEYKDLVNSVCITSGFVEFLDFVKEKGYEFVILSDGFESYIRMTLARLGIHNQLFFSNILNLKAKNPVIEFPYHNSECGYCGVCKAGIVASYVKRGYEPIFIGDGSSDIFSAHVSHKIFAKDRLAEYCHSQDLPFKHHSDFYDIMAHYKNGDFDVGANTPGFHRRCLSIKDGNISFGVGQV